jgi:hypothetical protein
MISSWRVCPLRRDQYVPYLRSTFPPLLLLTVVAAHGAPTIFFLLLFFYIVTPTDTQPHARSLPPLSAQVRRIGSTPGTALRESPKEHERGGSRQRNPNFPRILSNLGGRSVRTKAGAFFTTLDKTTGFRGVYIRLVPTLSTRAS